MEDPDYGWKPNNRPQSTVARNFSAALDDLFKIDGGIDDLDKNVHEKKQAVSTHNQELEALEARLRETEERLKRAKTSPPGSFHRKNSQRRTPIGDTFSEEDKARLGEAQSSRPMAQKQRLDAKQAASTNANAMPDRPQSARQNDQERQ